MELTLVNGGEFANWPRAHRATLRGGIGGGILGLAVGIAGVYGASWRYPAFRHLTLPFKTFIATSAGTFTGTFPFPTIFSSPPAGNRGFLPELPSPHSLSAIIAADRSSRAFEISRHPEEQYRDRATRDRAEAAKQQSTFQRFLAWGKENRYPIVGASWVASMGLAFAIVGRNPYLTTSQKIVQARVYAQGLTLAVLIATAAFEIGDRGKSDGMWETVKVIDPNDPEHKHLIEKKVHHESYRGEDMWRGWLSPSSLSPNPSSSDGHICL